MYLWLAIDVDDYYKDLKKKVSQIEKSLSFHYGTNGLPYHISLKISCKLPEGQEDLIIKDVESFYKTLKPFYIDVKGIEVDKGILWIRYYENDYIKYISQSLNKLLNEKYHIPYHKLDLNYKFHTTLYMNENAEILNKGYEKLKDEKLKNRLYLNKYLIGYSPEGLPETYKVLKKIIFK